MAGIVIKTITQVAYIAFYAAILYMVVYGGYLMYLKKKKNEAMDLAMGRQNPITKVLLNVQKFARHLKEK